MTSIVDATDAEAQAVCASLQAFNNRAVGPIRFTPIHLAARADDGEVIAGLVAEVALGWLEIHVLWVGETERGRGLGSALLDACERRARELGAHSARLDTFDWQAEAFYDRHGYRCFARLPAYPDDHERIFMSKALRAEVA
jgi:GNAT superfamily N-acetyltransferase